MKKLLNAIMKLLKKGSANFNTYVKTRDILILPKDDKTQITKDKREAVYDTLEKYKVFQELVGYEKYFIKVSDHVSAGIGIVSAYNTWKDPLFSRIETPFNLPRQNSDFICPTNLFSVRIECVNKYTTSYRDAEWGIDGYVLLMLVDPAKREIIDARGEVAK